MQNRGRVQRAASPSHVRAAELSEQCMHAALSHVLFIACRRAAMPLSTDIPVSRMPMDDNLMLTVNSQWYTLAPMAINKREGPDYQYHLTIPPPRILQLYTFRLHTFVLDPLILTKKSAYFNIDPVVVTN